MRARQRTRDGVGSSRLRRLTRDAATGITEALDHRPGGEEPGWRAERTARGVIRGLEEELAARPNLRSQVLDTLGGADVAERAQVLAASAVRGAARGAIAGLRDELGEAGDGRLARALLGAVHRATSDVARAVRVPLYLMAICGIGFASAALVRALRGQ